MKRPLNLARLRSLGVVLLLAGLVGIMPAPSKAGTTVTTTRYKFQANYRLQNPENPVGVFLNQDVEPSIKTDTDGDVYIGAIRGVPGGVDLWKAGPAQSSSQALVPAYLGQPDNFSQLTPFAPGGGDIDIATGLPYPTFPTNIGPVAGAPTGNLYSASLFLANIQIDTSKSQGGNGTWLTDAFATQTQADDRQWLAADGPSALYMVYSLVPGSPVGNIQTAISDVPGAEKMHDTGSFVDSATQTMGTPPAPISLIVNIAGQHHGNVVIDHHLDPVMHLPTLYVPFASVANLAEAQADATSITVPFHTLYIGIGKPVIVNGRVVSVSWHDVVAFNAPPTDGVDHVFPSMAVDQVGNVYVMFTFGGHVYYMASSNHGQTWNAVTNHVPYQVDSTSVTKYNLFPWLDAGSCSHVDFVWYGTNTANNPDNVMDTWNTYFAQTANAFSSNPTIYEQKASDHIIHTGQVCLLGISCVTGGNRNLADLFQVAIDNYGMANIAYTDDHITHDSHGNAIPPTTYYTRQLAGPGALTSFGQTTQLSGGGPINPFPNPALMIGTFALEVGYPRNSSVPQGHFNIQIPSLSLNLISKSITSLTLKGENANFGGMSNLGAYTVAVSGAYPDDSHPAALGIKLASGKTVNLLLPQGSIQAYNAW